MKNAIKRWLGIDKLEKVADSLELKTLIKYAQDEINSTKSRIEKAAFTGKITLMTDITCSYNKLYKIEVDDEICYISKNYNKVGYDVYYEATMDYVTISGPVAENLYNIVDKRYFKYN